MLPKIPSYGKVIAVVVALAGGVASGPTVTTIEHANTSTEAPSTAKADRTERPRKPAFRPIRQWKVTGPP